MVTRVIFAGTTLTVHSSAPLSPSSLDIECPVVQNGNQHAGVVNVEVEIVLKQLQLRQFY